MVALDIRWKIDKYVFNLEFVLGSTLRVGAKIALVVIYKVSIN